MCEKKQRGKNFSVEEELLLVDLVTSQKHVFENKKSDAVNWKTKTEAWMKLEEVFQSQSGVYRPWKALKDKYENIKRKAKMELASEKRETYRTGGGTPSLGLVSAVSEKILSVVGNTTTGLYNHYDNDANNNNMMKEDFLEDGMDISNSSFILEDDFPDIIEEKVASECSQMKKTLYIEIPSSSPKLKGAKKISNELIIPNRNKNTTVEEEKMKLLQLQQAFYEGENCRAAEKHKLEMEAMKLKNEVLALELKEKKEKSK